MLSCLILWLVRQVRDELSEEALYIRQLSPREYWEHLVAFADEHVYPGMSDRDWHRCYGLNGAGVNLMVGQGERDWEDPNYDEKLKLYRDGLRYAKHLRRPTVFPKPVNSYIIT